MGRHIEVEVHSDAQIRRREVDAARRTIAAVDRHVDEPVLGARLTLRRRGPHGTHAGDVTDPRPPMPDPAPPIPPGPEVPDPLPPPPDPAPGQLTARCSALVSSWPAWMSIRSILAE